MSGKNPRQDSSEFGLNLALDKHSTGHGVSFHLASFLPNSFVHALPRNSVPLLEEG
jgi:hypothetical protein